MAERKSCDRGGNLRTRPPFSKTEIAGIAIPVVLMLAGALVLHATDSFWQFLLGIAIFLIGVFSFVVLH